MSSGVSLLQLPRLCIWTEKDHGQEEDEQSRLLAGVGPHLEQYRLLSSSGEYSLVSRTAVLAACGRPLTAVRKVEGRDAFVVAGSSLLCIMEADELTNTKVPSSRIHSFHDEIVTIGFAVSRENYTEIGLVLRSGRTLCVRASIDASSNRLLVDTVAEYDRAKCGLLMSALCVIPAGASEPWRSMRSIAGSAMGEVRLWDTGEAESTPTTECGRIGFVIAMAIVSEAEDGETTVVAVTENRALNLWRLRYSDPDWLQLLCVEEAAHAVRPSAVACCSSQAGVVVSAAEDGELCAWRLPDETKQEEGFVLLRRFQTRVGAIRSLAMDGRGGIVVGSATGSLLVLPLSSLLEGEEESMILGPEWNDGAGEMSVTPIRSFTAVRSRYSGEEHTELKCLGEDGSTFTIVNDCALLEDPAGSFLHLNANWTSKRTGAIVYHTQERFRVDFHHVIEGSSRCESFTENSPRADILAVRATIDRGFDEDDLQAFVAVQLTSGVVMLIQYAFDCSPPRRWSLRLPAAAAAASSTQGCSKTKQQSIIMNTLAIDRSRGDEDKDRALILGTTNGRILYAELEGGGEGAELVDGESALEGAIDGESWEKMREMRMYPSLRPGKTAITSLEYCRRRRECVGLTKSGWMMRMKRERRGGELIVSEEEISRELGVEWPIRLERKGEREYLIGFNARNLIVVCRQSKRCLFSVDCGGGHRQVHVDLEARGEGGQEVERITAYYSRGQGVIAHSACSLTRGLRDLAWTPHRDKIVYCTGMSGHEPGVSKPDDYVLTGSIDGEIVLGRAMGDSLSMRHRWYLPETTAATMSRTDTGVVRVVIGGPKGQLFVAECSQEDRRRRRTPPLVAIPTGNDSRIIDVACVRELVVVAFADAQIGVFSLTASNRREAAIGRWEMSRSQRSMYMKINVRARDEELTELLIDATTSSGTLTRLVFNTQRKEFTELFDLPIDNAALTVIRRDTTSGVTVVGSDSGSIFVYRDSNEKLELIGTWKDAHVTQITDLTLYRTPSGALRIASVGMDCGITVVELEKDELSFVHRGVLAVNDPSSIHMMSDSQALVAGCGLEVVQVNRL